MTEDIKKLCIAVGVSVDMIAKKHNVEQDYVLELFIQTIQRVQKEMKKMTKTVFGSFIICCDYKSNVFYKLNSSCPTYNDKKVSIIQCKVKSCEDEKIMMMYELIFI